jgi:hypothetical protein
MEGLVYKSPVQSGFSAQFGRTATATGCLLWQDPNNRTETEKNRSKPVQIGPNLLNYGSVVTHKKKFKNLIFPRYSLSKYYCHVF